ncbi:hypothetical protein [Thalassoglobus sp.]|uniref:hypothetical protein n=1 Tax=Thalassoglobus sp. TaxID=2795869 RepID=UPI003AA7C7F9
MTMRNFLALLLTTSCLQVVDLQSANAQNLRVYTNVTDISDAENPRPLSHSLTLFHGGRVYDYMPEVGEVVIFEPIHNRFIILGKNYAATEVSFAEINHFLETAQTKAVQYIDELATSPDADSAAKAAAMRFQLTPEFQETFDEASNRLTLSGTEIEYSVVTQPVEATNAVNRYLEYADWTKRLNFVLHRHDSLPQARLKVNQKLRDRNVLPRVVELTMHLHPPVKFRAEHRFSDSFQSADRRLISQWEQTLESDNIRWMTFRKYQQNLLVRAD